MGMVGTGLQLRMELHAHIPGMLRHFHDLHQAAIGRQTAQAQARAGQRLAVLVIELVTVAVALADLIRTVNPG